MGLAIAKLLSSPPAAALKPPVPAGCTRFNARPSCRSPSAGGRRLAPEFGHTTMHADVPSADRATERALLLSRLPACLGPPVVVNGRYANVHYGLRLLFSSFSSFVVSLIKAQATCPFVVLLDNLYTPSDHRTFICFTNLYDILEVDPPPVEVVLFK